MKKTSLKELKEILKGHFEVDSTGFMHEKFLQTAPWLNRGSESRLFRLNSEIMAEWIDVWKVFGKNLSSFRLNELSEKYPQMALWVNFHNPNFKYSHQVDNIVHAAGHNNLKLLNDLLRNKDKTLNIVEILPVWAAIMIMDEANNNREEADSYPQTIMAMCTYLRLLARPATKNEKLKSPILLTALLKNKRIAPFKAYRKFYARSLLDFDIKTEVIFGLYFPYSTFVSATLIRNFGTIELNELKENWPDCVKKLYELNLSLGDTETQAADKAWSVNRKVNSALTTSYGEAIEDAKIPLLDFSL